MFGSEFEKMRQYLCIDLKSFYASVECVDRGLDPLKTNLVVADIERTDKTICLAITPAMKTLGIKNRCRVFEIPDGVEYITAPPRMKRYIDYAAEIYSVYLKYISKDDIHVYSIDEVFMDVTDYLSLYKCDAKSLAVRIMNDVFEKTGIRATCGIGTNLYLAKVALDITAKHSKDFIGALDEEGYIKSMWEHKPITDFWRIGRGTAERLASKYIYTMGDIARVPEDLLYKWFGIDAELLIDHAWGREPTKISDIKDYKAKTNCLTSGQVLMRDYSFLEGEVIIKEMMQQLCEDMLEKKLCTNSVTMYVGYSNSLKLPSARGTAGVAIPSNDTALLVPAAVNLYRRIVNPEYAVRRINLTCNRVVADTGAKQIGMFDDFCDNNKIIQKTLVDIKRRFGKNSILKGISLTEAATARERNRQIGGHKSGE